MQNIQKNFPITTEEYNLLNKKFGELCHYQAWQLLKMNIKNNCCDDQEDIVQDLRIAMMKAGSYYKRQIYIESCFEVLKSNCKDVFILKIIEELEDLWHNRTRHGANRQKFGDHQEEILYKLILRLPESLRPNRDAPLRMDSNFKTYCKQVTWNELKLKGKKITREKFWRTGMVSISEFDFVSHV